MNNLFAKCRNRTWSRAELRYDYFIINLFENYRIRTWNRAELSYECFIINLFANCRIRTWNRAELSYECFIINLLYLQTAGVVIFSAERISTAGNTSVFAG